jgi:hypothetical protein
MFPLLAFFLTMFVAIAIALIPVAVVLVALSIVGAIRSGAKTAATFNQLNARLLRCVFIPTRRRRWKWQQCGLDDRAG